MGYRMRMTLAFGFLALVSVVVLTLLFLTSSYREFRDDRMISVERMTTCLAGNIYWDMRAGDTGRVEESLARFTRGVPGLSPPAVLVLDRAARPYASSEGGTVPRPPPGVLDDLPSSREATTVSADNGFLSMAPIRRDQDLRGTVLVSYPLSSLREHFLFLFNSAVGYSLVLMLVLLGIGWLLGRQLVRPINHLRGCMARVGEGDLDVRCGASAYGDEIGELARGFDEMVAGLREKRLLEQEMLHAERLAAVGQVAAGVAHEINNPLGGMLNAINTFKHHDDDPTVAARTRELLERGLHQIQSTVKALLVEARVEEHPLTVSDMEDIRTLVGAEVRKKQVELEWHCAISGRVGLPSTTVRQILINLMLNAIDAVKAGGHVAVECRHRADGLVLRVADDGPGIPAEKRARIFDPFVSKPGGTGLGLWVTHQCVKQLSGTIEVLDTDAGTAIEVRLPISRGEPTGGDLRP